MWDKHVCGSNSFLRLFIKLYHLKLQQKISHSEMIENKQNDYVNYLSNTCGYKDLVTCNY